MYISKVIMEINPQISVHDLRLDPILCCSVPHCDIIRKKHDKKASLSTIDESKVNGGGATAPAAAGGVGGGAVDQEKEKEKPCSSGSKPGKYAVQSCQLLLSIVSINSVPPSFCTLQSALTFSRVGICLDKFCKLNGIENSPKS